MNLGAAQVDITPKPGVELCGFAARIQPSVGILDPLWAKALYLVDGHTRLLWLHCDLVGFDRSLVLAFRRWAQERLGLEPGQVMLSATHTHSGPCTIHLEECGAYDAEYVQLLQARLREAAQAAVNATEPVELLTVEAKLELAVDRRNRASAHTDPRIAAMGFRRPNQTFAAVVVNYAMHPVALGPTNRRVSADIPGQAAVVLAEQLAGNPVVLVTNGACGNLNPPAENVPFAQVQAWGRQVAEAVAPLLRKVAPQPAAGLRLHSRIVPLPEDTLDAEGINAAADKALLDAVSLAEWGSKYQRVVERWRRSQLAQHATGLKQSYREAELFAVSLGNLLLLGANAEVFSEFTDWVRRRSQAHVYLIGYANGDMGYLPTRAAYQEGGYEVEVAHLFYGGFRPKAGSLELLAQAAGELVAAGDPERT